MGARAEIARPPDPFEEVEQNLPVPLSRVEDQDLRLPQPRARIPA